MSNCNGKHDLINIMQTRNHDAPDAFNVARWCKHCGAIVVDVDIDGRTYAGNIMAMRLPSTTIASAATS